MQEDDNEQIGLMKRDVGAFELIGGALAVAGLTAFIYSYSVDAVRRESADTRVCEDNAYRLRMLVLEYMKDHDRLPVAEAARDAFVEMAKTVGRPNEEIQYLRSIECCCPGSHRATGNMGYVYTGSGVSTEAIAQRLAVVFFCSHHSHTAARQYSQFMRGSSLLSLRNDKLMRYLEIAVAAGKLGQVSYHPEALNRMESELEIRRRR